MSWHIKNNLIHPNKLTYIQCTMYICKIQIPCLERKHPEINNKTIENRLWESFRHSTIYISFFAGNYLLSTQYWLIRREVGKFFQIWIRNIISKNNNRINFPWNTNCVNYNYAPLPLFNYSNSGNLATLIGESFKEF